MPCTRRIAPSSIPPGTSRLPLPPERCPRPRVAASVCGRSSEVIWVMPNPATPPTTSTNAALTQATAGRMPASDPRWTAKALADAGEGPCGPGLPALAQVGLDLGHQGDFRPGGAAIGVTERGSASTGGPKPLDLVPAHMALDRWRSKLRPQLLERAKQVGADALLVDLVSLDAHTAPSASCRRSLSSPRRMRPFTVPIGISSISAIWLWLKPPK